MSIVKKVAVLCPSCQLENIVSIWESLNVALDPEAKKSLLEGSLNTYQCKACEQKVLVPVPFMYHDMDRQICVQFYPFDALRKPDFFSHFALDGSISKQVSKGLNIPKYMRNRHIVFDMSELVRYILFREQLLIYLDDDYLSHSIPD